MLVPKPRRSLLLIAIALSIVALAAMISTQHRMRMAIGVWKLVPSANDLNLDPERASGTWRFSVIRPALFTHTFDSARAIVTAFDRLPTAAPEAPHAMLDDPDSSLSALEHGRQLHCYNIDIAMTDLLGRHGIYARMWDIDGHDGLGGNGHNLLEVWDKASSAWRAFDPYYRCYFTADSSEEALSFGELRLIAMHSPGRLVVHHFIPENPSRPSQDIIAEYAELTPLASVHENNDFRARYDHRYGILTPLSFLLDKLPLQPARAFRTLMIGGRDPRDVVMDAATPKHSFRLVSYGFRLALLVAIVLLALDVFLAVRERRARRKIRRLKVVAARAS